MACRRAFLNATGSADNRQVGASATSSWRTLRADAMPHQILLKRTRWGDVGNHTYFFKTSLHYYSSMSLSQTASGQAASLDHHAQPFALVAAKLAGMVLAYGG